MNYPPPSRRTFISTSLATAATCLTPLGRAATAAEPLNIACIGTGGRMHPLLKNALQLKQRIVALCDVDTRQIQKIQQAVNGRLDKVAVHNDYRELLEKGASIDAVIVGTPDHWHYPICRDALIAGKHVFCEKPLTHKIEEARLLSQEAAARPALITQLGNQGSASGNMRRSMELIQAGLFGQIRDIHIWHPTSAPPTGAHRPAGRDPIPEGLDWKRWLGPAPERPYKKDIYHPFRWRAWYDFGNGFIGDFCCHAFNLPVRALKLGYPERVTVEAERAGGETLPANYTVHFHFPARGSLAATVIHMYVGPNEQLTEATENLVGTFGKRPRVGCLLVGDAGELSAGLWNTDCYVRLGDEAKFMGGGKHPTASAIGQSIPRSPGHMNEWIHACHGNGSCFSDFAFGSRLTEIGLSGILPLRTGRDITWDGEAMSAHGDEEASRLARRATKGQ